MCTNVQIVQTAFDGFMPVNETTMLRLCIRFGYGQMKVANGSKWLGCTRHCRHGYRGNFQQQKIGLILMVVYLARLNCIKLLYNQFSILFISALPHCVCVLVTIFGGHFCTFVFHSRYGWCNTFTDLFVVCECLFVKASLCECVSVCAGFCFCGYFVCANFAIL